MDKPQSLSIKDYIVRKLAVKTMLSETLIDAIVTHQFKEVVKATENNDSVEISGFGKILFNKGKAQRILEKEYSKKALFEAQLNNSLLPESKRRRAALILESVYEKIKTLEDKLKPNEHFTSDRGMEEQSNSTLQFEDIDTGDIKTETFNM